MNKRKQKGASLALVATLLFAFAVLVVGIVALINLLGGGQQMQRATDAGNLSLVRSALTKVSVPLAMSGDQVQFNGCSDPESNTNGNVNLRNINKLNAQALLVAINAYDIQKDGLDSGALSHSAQVNNVLKVVSGDLANKLQEPGAVHSFFTNIAQLNPTKQFGTDDINAMGAAKPSFMERATASNVYIDPKQFPDYDSSTNASVMFNSQGKNWVTNVSSHPGKSYLKGYLDGITPNSSLASTYFVPLMPGTKPHLVSQASFVLNTNPKAGANTFNWDKAVPNALSLTSKANSKQGYLGNFNAFALVAPIDPEGYPVAIPRGFIRLQNGSPSPATGVAGGGTDAFVQAMDHPFSYPSADGKPLPYLVSQGDPGLGGLSPAQYLQNIINANNSGQTPNCSALRVGFALSGDSLGSNGVSSANCATINGVGGTDFDNNDLNNPLSQPNQAMKMYNQPDSRNLWARPIVENAYNIPKPTPVGSNNESVNVADIFNLALLTARATGDDFHPTTYHSGVAHIPTTGRGPLNAPDFRITKDQGVWLNSQSPEGISKNGKMWKFLTNRCNQIDPTWNQDLDAVLKQAYIPMGGRCYIYRSENANGGKGAIVLKEESQAFADAPWLKDFAGQKADAKQEPNPTEMKTVELEPFQMVDVPGDWGYPVPYDYPGRVCVLNWYSFTRSSGWNNLLGQVTMGASTSNCCPTGSSNPTSSFTIQQNGGNDVLNMPAGCYCQSGGGCDYTGPC